MWFRQVVREETGCASYLVGSAQTGECLAFDPIWSVEPLITLARESGYRITRVVDSHAHADHVSGARRLARKCDATLLLPKRMEVSYPAQQLSDGELFRLGEVEFKVIRVPGHRPEQINLLIYDLSRGPEPWCLLSADFLLVGDLARPDLAQDGEEGAVALFNEALPHLQELPDFVEVYPGHVSGST